MRVYEHSIPCENHLLLSTGSFSNLESALNMPPQEHSPLLPGQSTECNPPHVPACTRSSKRKICFILVLASTTLFIVLVQIVVNRFFVYQVPTGPYKIIEKHEGQTFFDFYAFYSGADSLGSAGYNSYVGRTEAQKLKLFNVSMEQETEYVFMSSSPTNDGPRKSIRLEGKRRFNRGLFLLDLEHMPSGCGVWPAFWLTDEKHWPNHGEIDIVEGVNNQTHAKTALHTSESCSMYAHVPPYDHTGTWDSATGVYNTWTGLPDNVTHVPADNCWVMAPHQWANQGCVMIENEGDTIGAPLNDRGGGIYVLEWDPEAGYIKSWIFAGNEVPGNLQEVVENPSTVIPRPEMWGLPYAFFAIGERSGCSSDHFKDMRIVLNLAFCGTVSGNRFVMDCPEKAQIASTLVDEELKYDPVALCNAYIRSNPDELEEAYWKIRGAYVFERAYQWKK